MRAVGFGLAAIYQCTARLLVVAVGFIVWILGKLFFVRDYQQINEGGQRSAELRRVPGRHRLFVEHLVGPLANTKSAKQRVKRRHESRWLLRL